MAISIVPRSRGAATTESGTAEDGGIQPRYYDFAVARGFDACMLSSKVRAVRALLEQFEGWDGDVDLTAAHIVLGAIERDADTLRDNINDSSNDFVAKEASHG